MWECLKVVIHSFNSFIMYFTDEELQKWKVGDFRKYLLQRGVPICNNARKANLIEKVIFAQKLDLPIQPSQEEHKKEILNAKHNRVLMVCKYLTPLTSKKIGLLEVNTYQVLFWKILRNMQNLIRRKLQRKGEIFYFLAM